MRADLDLAAVLAALRRNAAAIDQLVADVTDAQARWKPAPDKWSILEVVTHLADEEVEDFRARVRSTLEQPEAEWTPIDPPGWAVQRRYNEGSLPEQLARFTTERATSMAWLGSLKLADWMLAHVHPKWGPFQAGDLLTAWVGHDHIHIRQLNRLHREYLVEVVSGFSAGYAGAW